MASPHNKKPQHYILSLKTHFLVFIILLTLTALSVFASHLNLGSSSFYVAIFIAIIQAYLVASFLMHLKFDPRFNALVFVSSLVVFAVFVGLTIVDITTRGKVIAEQGNFVLSNDLALAREAAQGADLQKGETIFKQFCAACHALDQRLVGPPMKEAAAVYKGNPTGVMEWVRKPGKKRADYPQMPPIAKETLTDQDLELVANYIQQLTGNK